MGELKDKASRYASEFDGASPLGDPEGRSVKAAKVRAVLEADGVDFRPGIRILDIGCSYGLILRTITPDGGYGVGVDMDESLGCVADNLDFLRADAENLPFRAGSFDVVICNHVYEHTDDAEKLVAEISRVMTDSGRCYFAGPNKFEIVEPHYGLPFLSWLPRGMADAYMRLAGRGNSYPEKPYSYRRLRRLLAGFDVRNCTGAVLRDPVRYSATDMLQPGTWKQRIALLVYRVAPCLFPGFIFVLRKQQGQPSNR